MAHAGQRFVGGMNIVADFGGLHRLNVTVPLARLTVEPDGLNLAGVGFLDRLLPSKRMRRQHVVRAFRSEGLLTVGVGVELDNGEVNYFWCLHPPPVLRALHGHGYRLGPGRRPRRLGLLKGVSNA